jgi:hypothetical protein
MRLNVENARSLQQFLLSIPAKNFDHGRWQAWTWAEEDGPDLSVHEKNMCNTSACVGGWAVIFGNLAPYQVDEDGEVRFVDVHGDDADPDFGRLAGEWLGLETESERGALFWPFDINEDSCAQYDLSESEYYAYMVSGAFGSRTTPTQAAAFLGLMIERNGIDVRWWAEAKNLNVDFEGETP